jgi:hypothetical protein
MIYRIIWIAFVLDARLLSRWSIIDVLECGTNIDRRAGAAPLFDLKLSPKAVSHGIPLATALQIVSWHGTCV